MNSYIAAISGFFSYQNLSAHVAHGRTNTCMGLDFFLHPSFMSRYCMVPVFCSEQLIGQIKINKMPEYFNQIQLALSI